MVCPPLRWCYVQGPVQYQAIAPDPLLLLQAPQKQQLGFLVSLCPLSRICPNCACMQLFLVPDNSYFVAPGEMCLGASTAAKGPKSQFISSVTCICEVFLVRETFYTFTSFRKPPTGSINSICQKKKTEPAVISAFTKVFHISMLVLLSHQAVLHVKGLKISHLPPP